MTRHTADAINERLSDEARATLRTRIDLDAFLALSSEARAARWRQWDLAAKQDAVIQMLTRKYGEWDAELLAEAVAHYDAKWEVADLSASDRLIPPASDILTVVKEQRDLAQRWHVALYDLLLDMQEDAAADADDPEPAPPVDDGPQDTWGGFRAGLTYDVITIERRVVGASAGQPLGARLARARAALAA